MRLRRSELTTPADSEKLITKAAASEADFVMLDLEDAVAPSAKVEARGRAIAGLRDLDWGRKTKAVRVNSLGTPFAYEDIIQIVEGAREALDIITLPKIYSAREVWWLDTLLTQIETNLGMTKRIGIEALIEEVEAMINAEEIAKASPRLEAIIFGPGDYSASQGVPIESGGSDLSYYPGDRWHYARNKVAIAARASGIDAIEAGYGVLNNPDGYRAECVRARTLGFSGKWAIHPSQIEIANEVFSPPKEEVEQARRLLAAYEEAEAGGVGAIAVEGQMMDAASARILRGIVKRGELIGI